MPEDSLIKGPHTLFISYQRNAKQYLNIIQVASRIMTKGRSILSSKAHTDQLGIKRESGKEFHLYRRVSFYRD